MQSSSKIQLIVKRRVTGNVLHNFNRFDSIRLKFFNYLRYVTYNFIYIFSFILPMKNIHSSMLTHLCMFYKTYQTSTMKI